MAHNIDIPELQQIVTRQLRRWESERAAQAETRPILPPRPGPWITVSREPGSGGRAVGEAVARRLGFEFYDRRILDHMSRDGTHTREDWTRVEHGPHGAVHEAILMSLDHTWPGHHEYVKKLAAMAGELAARGRVVFLGRGLHFLLPAEHGLRVRMIASLPDRVRRCAEELKLSEADARREIEEIDRRQCELIERTMHRDLSDVHSYDLVLNSSGLDLDACVNVIIEAYEQKLFRNLAGRSERARME